MTPASPAKPRRIDTKKRVTLPDEVMEGLGLEPGDFVNIEMAGEKAVIRKVRMVAD